MDDCKHNMYEVLDYQTKNNSSIQQDRSATVENIHGYAIIPPGTFREPPNEYQIPSTNSTQGNKQQHLQLNDGDGICDEVKTKKSDVDLNGIKRCLVLLSLFVVIILLAVIASIVFTVVHYQNGLHSLWRSVSNLETQINTTYGKMADLGNIINMTIKQITNNMNSLRSLVTNFETRLNTEYTPMLSFRNLESKVNATDATMMAIQSKQRRQPVIRVSHVTIGVRASVFASFQRLNSETFVGQGSTTRINISPSLNSTSTNNILAYRPNYPDSHGSDLATLFLNLEAIYPCISSFHHVSCKLFPNEDDGFRGGRAVFEASDNGRNFQIFGTSVTYGFAVEGCRELTSDCTNIPPGYDTVFILVCLLPSRECSEIL